MNASNTEKQINVPPNQKSAREHPDQIRRYLNRELARGSLIGPFHTNPFGNLARFSPLDTREKKDSLDHRIILNLSYPFEKGSVNHSINKNSFVGKSISLRYPTVEDLAHIVRRKGKNCKIFKRDIEACYKQFFMDPGDIHLLGFTFENKFYFDVTLSMGARSACYSCQMTTNMITEVFFGYGFEEVNYLDDLGGAEVPELAQQAFDLLGQILERIGIRESSHKACPPNTIAVFLGVLFNTVTMTMEITRERRLEILGLVDQWLDKQSATLNELQQLLGKLSFASSTIRSSRIFVSRLINFMKALPEGKPKVLTEDFKKDLIWWKKFLDEFNGVSIIPSYVWEAPDRVMSTDACLTGCGGFSEGEYFHAKFPKDIIKNYSVRINELESLALVVALKIWSHKYTNKSFLMYCDNQTTVDVVNSGRAKNEFAQACLREIAYLTARNNSIVRVVHIMGKNNRIPDSLSRWDSEVSRRQFFEDTRGFKVVEIKIDDDLFEFEHDW